MSKTVQHNMTAIIAEAQNDPRLVDLLCDLSNAAHKAAHCRNLYALRSGACWINGRPVRTDYSSEELEEKAVAKARKACRIANILRKEYGLRYDRFYDLTKDSENFRLAAEILRELGEAIGDDSMLEKADELTEAAEAVA